MTFSTARFDTENLTAVWARKADAPQATALEPVAKEAAAAPATVFEPFAGEADAGGDPGVMTLPGFGAAAFPDFESDDPGALPT